MLPMDLVLSLSLIKDFVCFYKDGFFPKSLLKLICGLEEKKQEIGGPLLTRQPIFHEVSPDETTAIRTCP